MAKSPKEEVKQAIEDGVRDLMNEGKLQVRVVDGSVKLQYEGVIISEAPLNGESEDSE